jgi:glycosyltransferase involved in cell wall biosynthesis
MKVLVLIPSLRNTSPGSRFRIEQWARYLGRVGIECDTLTFEDSKLHETIYQPGKFGRKAWHMGRAMLRRLGHVLQARGYDLLFVYEEMARLGPPVFEWLLRRFQKPIVYDFCDPIYVPYVSPVNRYLSYLKCFSKYASICQWSSHVIVGNEMLAEFARQHNKNVSVIPITIDTERYRAQMPAKPASEKVVVGWSGSVTTVPHLELLRGPLHRLQTRTAYELSVIGALEPAMNGVPFSFKPWRQESEVEDLQRFDIGIMPLPDDRWTRLRSHLKVRQYMGIGIPTVASPVGIMPELIQDGVNGFLATTPEEWVDKLDNLIKDSRLRRRLGEAAYQTIEDRYSTRVWAPKVAEIFETVANR